MTATTAPPFPSSSATRRPLAARSARHLLYALASVPLAGLAFAVVVTAWSVTLSLAYTPLVVPLLVASAAALRLVAAVEAPLARSLLAADVADPAPPAPVAGFWARAGRVLRDGAFWRRQAWCVLRMVVGLPLACLSLSVLAAGLFAATAPIHYRFIPQDGRHGIEVGFWFVDTFAEAVTLVPAGLALAVGGVGLLHVCALVWRALAERLLPDGAPSGSGAGDRAAASGRPAGTTSLGASGASGASGRAAWSAPLPGTARRLADRATADRAAAPAARPSYRLPRVRALAVHGMAAAGVAIVVTTVWAATTRDYFWPYWPILALAVGLAVHALVDEVGRRRLAGWTSHRVTPALAIHGGVSVVVEVALVAVWAFSWRRYPWPVWSGVGLALPLGVHWLAALSGSADASEARRAQAVDVQEGDLRRIERDLHDGAQARLVALGMHLGMAEQKLASDPEAARALVSEARRGVQEALTELRDLVRGIRPPVLADRGLEAAIWSLVDRMALPVEVRAALEVRPPDTVETAAYFVVAEALTNAAKHAGADRIEVALERRGTMLVVEIVDDGRGGADPAGRGLVGLRQRVEAVGGVLAVVSPVGGPTVVRAEIPCGR